jgi:transcriptional regulator with XRE-family HTH domain
MFPEIMLNELTFGQLLKKMRFEMRYVQIPITRKPISQEHLADGIDYNVKTIRSLENDERDEKDYKLILAIANFFQLTEQQKREFFWVAGLFYQPKFNFFSKEEFRNNIEEHLKDVTYPSQVITPTWDILAFNKYTYHLYEYNSEKIAIMKTERFGTNLLTSLFDKRFEMKKFFGDHWRFQMIRNVKAFRALSLRYISSAVYSKLINMMMDKPDIYEGFKDIWYSSYDKNQISTRDEVVVDPSTTVIINSNPMEKVKFWTLRFPQEYIGGEAIILGHIPINAEYEKIFHKFRDNLPSIDQHVYHFDLPNYLIE